LTNRPTIRNARLAVEQALLRGKHGFDDVLNGIRDPGKCEWINGGIKIKITSTISGEAIFEINERFFERGKFISFAKELSCVGKMTLTVKFIH
jgi:hypothetical protein